MNFVVSGHTIRNFKFFSVLFFLFYFVDCCLVIAVVIRVSFGFCYRSHLKSSSLIFCLLSIEVLRHCLTHVVFLCGCLILLLFVFILLLFVKIVVYRRDGTGHGSPGQRFCLGQVTGQCVRPSVWPGFEYACLSGRCFYVGKLISEVSVSVRFGHSTTGLLISVFCS